VQQPLYWPHSLHSPLPKEGAAFGESNRMYKTVRPPSSSHKPDVVLLPDDDFILPADFAALFSWTWIVTELCIGFPLGSRKG
jgi:hypothetical protein